MSLSLSHWYPGSGVYLIVSIPDLCTLPYFSSLVLHLFSKPTCKYDFSSLVIYLFSKPTSKYEFSSLVIYLYSKPTSKKKHKEVIQYFTICNQSTFTCNPKTILLFRQTIENVSLGVLTDIRANGIVQVLPTSLHR